MVSIRYLLDTNVLSEPVRPVPNPRVVEKLLAYEDVVATASPVWHAVLFGYRRLPPSRRRESLERYLFDIVRLRPILPYDQPAAEWHAAERARLASLGRTPPYINGQIAAIAAVNGLTLVTANVADFATFSGLQVEDWRS